MKGCELLSRIDVAKNLQIVNEEFIPKTHFLEDISIEHCKSDASVLFGELEERFEKNGLDWKKCLAFGSDGASVMTCLHNGVAARVKQKNPHCVNIHCMAHRLNLCTSQASKNTL